MKTTPVIYKQEKDKTYRICKSENLKWTDIPFPYAGYVDSNKEMNKICNQLNMKGMLSAQRAKMIDLALSESKNRDFIAGYYIEVIESEMKSSDSKALIGKAGDKYFCAQSKLRVGGFGQKVE